MTPAERALHALELRRSGMTLQQIGAKLGVTRERARQLIINGERELERRAAAASADVGDIRSLDLSTRAWNVLYRDEGCRTIDDVCRYSEYELLRTPHFGRLSLAEVTAALARVGRELAPRRRPAASWALRSAVDDA